MKTIILLALIELQVWFMRNPLHVDYITTSAEMRCRKLL